VDIVTHGMMGSIVAIPFFATYPEASAAFMFGSVAPDLDAFSRVLGRRAFLRAHQTYSHAFPVIALIAVVAWGAREAAGVWAPWAPLAFALGMAFHSTLDWTNTYGITLFAPFSKRRFCTEWVFFVDSVVLAACAAALAAIGLSISRGDGPGTIPSAVFAGSMFVYWLIKVGLRRRAWRACPEGTLSLLPSALFPWRFYGCSRQGEEIVIFRVQALTGVVDDEQRLPILDDGYTAMLNAVPEYTAMQALTPAYHVVETTEIESGVRLVCRDLRTRNFSTRFGQLDLELDGAGQVHKLELHV
jgi:membrane-bound metal-dependent hydrolase YbcI (DUF457 family)